MKKRIIAQMAGLLVLAAGSITVTAAYPAPAGAQRAVHAVSSGLSASAQEMETNRIRYFVDENDNGICDHREQQPTINVDANATTDCPRRFSSSAGVCAQGALDPCPYGKGGHRHGQW